MLKKVRALIPPFSHGNHKGSSGRVGVLGGCLEYTGAPYFAAMTALRMGADLSYIFCDESAAVPIKCYSPDLIVSPFIDLKVKGGAEESIEKLEALLPRLHSLVIGPGLGRDPKMLDAVEGVILACQNLGLPLVLDGDALWLVARKPQVIRGYKKAVITPNEMEFRRIAQRLFPGLKDPATLKTREMAEALGGVTVLRKGKIDEISDGVCTVQCDYPGSARRCGGQGDFTAGAVGTLLGWGALSSCPFASSSCSEEGEGEGVGVVAGYGAVMITKKTNELAFRRFKRGFVAGDMVSLVGEAFEELFPLEEDKESSGKNENKEV